jgi:hypothetical protein
LAPVGNPAVSLPNGIDFTFVAGPRTIHGATLAYRWTDIIEQNTATLRKS